MSGRSTREIDWASAAVAGGTLTVELIGEAPRGWRRHFEGVVRLLDQAGGRWGRISIARNTITVAAVRDGHEADLRHLLESVIQQVNADLGPGQDPPEQDADGEPTDAERAHEADRAMAAAFRAFAQPPR